MTRIIPIAVLSILLLGATCHRHVDFESPFNALKGVVTDLSNADRLIGASVEIKGTAVRVLTNIDGQYWINRERLSELFSGEQTIRVSSVGFEPKETTIVLRQNGIVRCDVVLKSLAFDKTVKPRAK